MLLFAFSWNFKWSVGDYCVLLLRQPHRVLGSYMLDLCVCVSTANSAFEIEEKESSFEQCARLYRVIKSLFISIML